MNKIALLSALVFIQVSTLPAQTETEENTKQKEMKYYKKKMVPTGEDYLENAPITFSKSITINAPIADVWKVIDNTPGFVDWFPGVKWAKMENASEKGLNAKRLAQLDGNKYYEMMIAYEKEKKWGFTMLESNSGMLKTITEVIYLERVDANTTKVTVKGGYAPKGIAKLMKGAIYKAIDKTWAAALSGLENHVEKG